MTTFLGMETMRRAVGANRIALQTVGNNIANAGTPGYSRQKVNLHATGGYPGSGPFGQPIINGRIGTGVEVGGIERIRDQFLDRQFRSEAHVEGAAFIQYRTLERLEDLYNEAPTDNDFSSGLSSQFSAFWNGWKELAAGQENEAVLMEQAKSITDAFAHLQSSFSTERSTLEQEAKLTTDKINALLKQIEANNKMIGKAEVGGQVPNELYDEQDRLLDELSVLVPIQVSRTESTGNRAQGAEGVYQVMLLTDEEPVALVGPDSEGPSYFELQDGVQWTVGSNTPFQYSGSGGGELSGLQKAYERVGQELNSLNELAGMFAEEVNERYALGQPEESDQRFFIFDSESGKLTVNQSLLDNPKSLNVDKTTAENIGKLADDGKVMGTYRDMMGKLGVETQAMRRETQASNARLANTDANRMSMSSVSLDEELTMLIQYQHSYNAAARVMTTMDEMLNTIINGMGVVGR